MRVSSVRVKHIITYKVCFWLTSEIYRINHCHRWQGGAELSMKLKSDTLLSSKPTCMKCFVFPKDNQVKHLFTRSDDLRKSMWNWPNILSEFTQSNYYFSFSPFFLLVHLSCALVHVQWFVLLLFDLKIENISTAFKFTWSLYPCQSTEWRPLIGC